MVPTGGLSHATIGDKAGDTVGGEVRRGYVMYKLTTD